MDQDDNVLDMLVKSRRNKKAAKKFFEKLLKGLQGVPRVIITDQLKSYAAVKGEEIQGTASLSASAYRHEMSHRFESWAETTGTERALPKRQRGPGNVPACLDGISFN